MNRRQIILFITFLIAFLAQGVRALQTVDDETFLESLKKEYLLAYFTKSTECEECGKIEGLIDTVASRTDDEINTVSVKIVNSQLTRLYAPNREPAVVFFRHGIGMLLDVDSTWDEAELYHKIVENVQPSVKELTDATFEHLTQAATGATTGDWLVYFYSQQCVDCQRLNALWEGVASELKHSMNVARVNSESGGVETGKRFNVQKVPEFILVRKGKFYKYEIKKLDIKSFVGFATQGYKNVKPYTVRAPSTPFDDAVAKSVTYLRYFVDTTTRIRQEQPYFFLTVVSLLLILMGLIFARQRHRAVPTTKAQKKRTRKDKSK